MLHGCVESQQTLAETIIPHKNNMINMKEVRP